MMMNSVLDFIMPRFITEEVALELTPEGYLPVIPISQVEPGEKFDGVVTMWSFNLFGFALFPRTVGEVRPWPY